MARVKEVDDPFYEAAERFVDSCLRDGGSLFTPGRPVWTAEPVNELYERFAGHPDFAKGPGFIQKLEAQLHGAGDLVFQLAAEVLYVLLLAQATDPEKKRAEVQAILADCESPAELPADLSVALAHGFSSFGAALAKRFYRYCFLLEFARAWTQQSQGTQHELLASPDKLRVFVDSLESKNAASEVEALLYIVFPDSFEPITSIDAKKRIVETFAAYAGDPALPVDRRLVLIREAVAHSHGDGFSFYDRGLRSQWDHAEKLPGDDDDRFAMGPWDQFVYWAGRLYADERFDERERDYKLVTAAELGRAREAFQNGGSWLPQVDTALQSTNLLNWRVVRLLTDWAAADGKAAESALHALWDSDEVTESSIDRFAGLLPDQTSSGNRAALASVLSAAIDPTRYPPYRPEPVRSAMKLLGIPTTRSALRIDLERTYRPDELAGMLGLSGTTIRGFLRERFPRPPEEKNTDWQLDPEQVQAVIQRFRPGSSSDAGARYDAFLELIDELADRMRIAGTELRDRLDAQGLLWWVSSADPPEDWSSEEREAFLAFQQGEAAEPPEEKRPEAQLTPMISAVDEGIAQRLHLPRAWLQQAVDLLNEKRQAIFYGPPGTGKTFVAKALGEHVRAAGGDYRLVQFHPAYSYEDFFEGYRPSDPDGSGTLQFALRGGPLRLLADAAAANRDSPYLLVIDEINRGNIAKIFGELYFLLEYRDEPIQLQYSPETQFRLPSNLFVIGTMNTADRSIALVDTALRRRFYFLPFLPTELPIEDVLESWLEARGYDTEPARLLKVLNDTLREALPDDEFAIGPSYFMTSGAPPNLETVWRYAIAPLLEERFYGARSRSDVEREFGLPALRAAQHGTPESGEPTNAEEESAT